MVTSTLEKIALPSSVGVWEYMSEIVFLSKLEMIFLFLLNMNLSPSLLSDCQNSISHYNEIVNKLQNDNIEVVVGRSDNELTTLFRGIHAFQKGFQLDGCCY